LWTFDGQQESYTETPVWDTTSETYSVSSQYRTVVDKTDNGKSLTCSVNHGTIATPKSATVTISVLCKLKLNMFLMLLLQSHLNMVRIPLLYIARRGIHVCYMMCLPIDRINLFLYVKIYRAVFDETMLFPNSQSKHCVNHW